MGSCSRKPEVKEITSNALKQNIKQEKIKTESNVNHTSLPNSDYNSTSNEYVRGEFLGKGKIGECYSSLSLNSGKLGVIKQIDLSKFDVNIEKARTSIIEEFNKINDSNNINKNLNTYLAYQSVENNDNCKLNFHINNLIVNFELNN
jgi:hypothetical protein